MIHGEEALLALEAADRIRASAKRKGFVEREVLIVEPGFDWRRLRASGASLSLFATQRLLELRIPGSGPGRRRRGGADGATPPTCRPTPSRW